MIALTVIAALLLILLFLVIGVDAQYGPEGILVLARIGPLRLRVYPQDPKKAARKAAKPKKEKKEKPPKTGEGEPEKKFGREQIFALIPMARRALGRLRTKLSVDLIAFHYTAASDDPFKTAMQLGRISAAVDAAFPVINELFTVRRWDLRTNADFTATSSTVFVHLIASYSVWELLYVAFSFGYEFLRYMLAEKRRVKKAENIPAEAT